MKLLSAEISVLCDDAFDINERHERELGRKAGKRFVPLFAMPGSWTPTHTRRSWAVGVPCVRRGRAGRSQASCGVAAAHP